MTAQSLPDDSGDNPARATAIAELAQIYALPCSEIESAVCDRQCQHRAYDDCFGMRWHIVRTFVGVKIVRRVLRDKTVEDGAQIVSDIRIGVLVERERRRRMLDHKVKQSSPRKLRKCPKDLRCDEAEATRTGAKRKFSLYNHLYSFW